MTTYNEYGERLTLREAWDYTRIIAGFGLGACAMVAERLRERISRTPAFGSELAHLQGTISAEEQVAPRALAMHVQRARYLHASTDTVPGSTLIESRAYCMTGVLLRDTQRIAAAGAHHARDGQTVSFEQALNVAASRRAEAEQDPQLRARMLDALDLATAGARGAFDQVNFEVDATHTGETPIQPTA
jgi:hypothetical protein